MDLLIKHFLVRVSKNKVLLLRLSIVVLLIVAGYLWLFYHHYSGAHSSTTSLKYLKQFRQLNPVNESWGQQGEPVILTGADEKEAADRLFSSAAFNVYISDRIRYR